MCTYDVIYTHLVDHGLLEDSMKTEVMLQTTCLVVYIYIAGVTVVCCFQKGG